MSPDPLVSLRCSTSVFQDGAVLVVHCGERGDRLDRPGELGMRPRARRAVVPPGPEDPLAVRLALLASPCARPILLTHREIADAARDPGTLA